MIPYLVHCRIKWNDGQQPSFSVCEPHPVESYIVARQTVCNIVNQLNQTEIAQEAEIVITSGQRVYNLLEWKK